MTAPTFLQQHLLGGRLNRGEQPTKLLYKSAKRFKGRTPQADLIMTTNPLYVHMIRRKGQLRRRKQPRITAPPEGTRPLQWPLVYILLLKITKKVLNFKLFIPSEGKSKSPNERRWTSFLGHHFFWKLSELNPEPSPDVLPTEKSQVFLQL